MKKFEDIVIDKLDSVDQRLQEVNETLVRNTVSLEEHERRTTIAETRLDYIEKHVHLINAIVKIGGFASALVLFLYQLGVLRFF